MMHRIEWRVEPEHGMLLRSIPLQVRGVPSGELGKRLGSIIVGRRPEIYFEKMRCSGLAQMYLA